MRATISALRSLVIEEEGKKDYTNQPKARGMPWPENPAAMYWPSYGIPPGLNLSSTGPTCDKGRRKNRVNRTIWKNNRNPQTDPRVR